MRAQRIVLLLIIIVGGVVVIGAILLVGAGVLAAAEGGVVIVAIAGFIAGVALAIRDALKPAPAACSLALSCRTPAPALVRPGRFARRPARVATFSACSVSRH